MTYRERRLAKAERLRGWAADRTQKATAQLNSQQELRHDWAFITQPGHIPERARMNARDDRAFESLDKAKRMESRADAIEHQADRAIYSDDEDAPERLKEKIAALEASRDHKKAVNAALRKARSNRQRKGIAVDSEGLLLDLFNSDVITIEEGKALAHFEARFPYHGLGYPAYEITNLGANIRRQKERLAEIERVKTEGPRWHYYHASKYESVCLVCDKTIDKGTAIVYRKGTGEAKHFTCYQSAQGVQS